MTQKEKAKELVNKFYQPLGLMSIKESSDTLWNHACLCASICIDEIIKELHEYGDASYELQNMDRTFAYYDKVKNEIEQL